MTTPNRHLLLCHLEEVLADDRWRRHHITTQPRDHDAYDRAGHRDPAFPATCALITAYPGPVHVITTRSERFRRDAERWLAHHVGPLPLHMRPLDDDRPAVNVVLSRLDAMRNSDLYPTIAFAADPVIIQAYRRRGIACFDSGLRDPATPPIGGFTPSLPPDQPADSGNG